MTDRAQRPPVLVLGVGNPLRGDDGVGAAVIAALDRAGVGPDVELAAHGGEATGLLEAWRGRRLAIVVDAVRSGRPAGTVHRFDHGGPDPGWQAGPSGHGHGLGHALALARALDRRPDRLVVHGVEAGDLTLGAGLSPAVEAAVGLVVERILRDLQAGASLSPSRPGAR